MRHPTTSQTLHTDWALASVIATGASYKEGPPFKGLGSTEETKAALNEWRKRIKAAKSIVVAGGGATGTEVAGELGDE